MVICILLKRQILNTHYEEPVPYFFPFHLRMLR